MGDAIKIGWVQTSITPDKPVNLFGMFNERISTHVEEPCTATALALEGRDGEQAVWVSCDLVSVTLEATTDVRNAVAERIPGFKPEKLLISSTHTHNAPNFKEDLFPNPPEGVMTPGEYRVFFVEQVAAAAVKAWETRKPGQIAPALGHAVLGWCRRVVFADGSGQMYGDSRRDDFVKVEGPMDPGMEIIFTYDSDGNHTGAVVSIACTAQTCMGENFLTADIWGVARRKLASHFGENFHVLAITDAAGDQCPDDLIRWGRSEPRLRGVSACEELARRLVNGVIEAHEYGRRATTANPLFRHCHAVFQLPAFKMDSEQTAYYERIMAKLTENGEPDPRSWDGGTLLRTKKQLKRHAELEPGATLAVDCNFLRIGDVAVATNPFELYMEYGHRIKARSPATQTIVSELTNQSGLGYLPTREALAHGHYSAMPGPMKVSPDGGDMLVEKSLDQLRELWEATSS